MRGLIILGLLAGLLSGFAETGVVDFSRPCGEVRPLNGLCNGPLLYGRGRGGQVVQWLKELEIPYTRLHDVPLENPGMEVVDVSRIFPLFHADYDDPRNFNFGPTDDYVRNCLATGTELDFRFGETIEHTERRYRAVVPPDIARWAEICVRIARHYRPSVKSWSIWEEPNNKLLLDGPNAYPEAFCRMYVTLAKRLKEEFPDMPVGGPALMGTKESELRAFLAACRDAGAPLDFFSYTNYGRSLENFAWSARLVRKLLDEHGFAKTRIHVAEWHRGPDSWNIAEIGHDAYFRSLTGDAATAYAGQILAGAQDLPVDRLYYYCAFLNNWGLFGKGARRPVWYVFKAFSDLRKTGPRVAATAPEGWKVLAAAGPGGGRLMLAGMDAAAKAGVRVDVKGGLVPTAVRLVGAGLTDGPATGWTCSGGVLSLPSVPSGGAVWIVDCARPHTRIEDRSAPADRSGAADVRQEGEGR